MELEPREPQQTSEDSWNRISPLGIRSLPSRKLTYPTWGSLENHLQNGLFRGYVSSLEGISLTKKNDKKNSSFCFTKERAPRFFLVEKMLHPKGLFSKRNEKCQEKCVKNKCHFQSLLNLLNSAPLIHSQVTTLGSQTRWNSVSLASERPCR